VATAARDGSAVSKEPRSGGHEDARFSRDSEEFYVYLNRYAGSRCRGFGRGNPREIPRVILELIEIYQDPTKEQKYSMSRPVYPTVRGH